MFGLYHFFYLSLRELLVKHFEMRILSLVCAALLLCSSRMSANNKLDLKAVTDGSLSAQTISGITPIEGSDLYTQISSDGKRVVRYSFKTGKQTDVLFDIDDTQGEKLNRFDGYILSPDGKRMLIRTQKKAVYRRITFIPLHRRSWRGYLTAVRSRYPRGRPTDYRWLLCETTISFSLNCFTTMPKVR